MRAKINGVEVEGTPEEIATLLRSLPLAFAQNQPNDSSPATTQSISEEFAFKVLKRRSLSQEQIAVLSLLRRNHPDWTTAFDLHKATKYSPNQLAGLLGAFGKRVASTEGFKQGTSFFEAEWDYDLDCYKYRLADGSLIAVRRAGI